MLLTRTDLSRKYNRLFNFKLSGIYIAASLPTASSVRGKL